MTAGQLKIRIIPFSGMSGSCAASIEQPVCPCLPVFIELLMLRIVSKPVKKLVLA